MKNILVIGATGQIGSELTLELRKRYGDDHVVAGYIPSAMPKGELKASGPSAIADVTDRQSIEVVARQFKIDTIYNLAALLSVVAESRPAMAWKIGIDGLWNVLEVAREYNCAVFTPSSIGSFGEATPHVKTPQDTIQRPRTMYGVTKVTTELLSDYYYTKYGVDNWNTSPTGYNLKKFLDEDYVPNSWNFKAKNWIWFRVAELYLNKAEALYHTGDEDGARDAVNEVRNRAGMPDITSTGEQLLEDIKHERRIELAFEEHRYFDVRRWMEADKYLGRTMHAITVKKYPDGHKTYEVSDLRSDVGGDRIWDDKMYWLPILKTERDKNPGLVQNPLYTD